MSQNTKCHMHTKNGVTITTMESYLIYPPLTLQKFLGKLLKKAAGAVGRFARSSAGRAIGGVLRSIPKVIRGNRNKKK